MQRRVLQSSPLFRESEEIGRILVRIAEQHTGSDTFVVGRTTRITVGLTFTGRGNTLGIKRPLQRQL